MTRISQANLVVDMMRLLARKHGVKTMRPDQISAVIAAVNQIVASQGTPERPASAGMGLTAWLASHDTGLSSLFMAAALFRKVRPQRYAHPHDPSDFGRCVRFLQAVPEARARLPELSGWSNTWARLVDAWPELEALYNEESPSGTCPKLYDRMKQILDAAECQEKKP